MSEQKAALNELGYMLKRNLERKRADKKMYAEREQWDRCLHIEGQIWAYETMWGELMGRGLLTTSLLPYKIC